MERNPLRWVLRILVDLRQDILWKVLEEGGVSLYSWIVLPRSGLRDGEVLIVAQIVLLLSVSEEGVSWIMDDATLT